MQDVHRIAHFDLLKAEAGGLSLGEAFRVQETVAMVPTSWRRIVDVGCGDGRISLELMKRGCEITGIDWSEKSLAHFPGQTRVCDIRAPWPFDESFDGAVCCEVLEHLEQEEAKKVVANLKVYSRSGFLVTVPAREPFDAHFVQCQRCTRRYHIWGHCQRFNTFEDVDAMVGELSVERRLISSGGLRSSEWLSGLQGRLGFTPWAPSYLCPRCGEKLKTPLSPSLLNRIANKAISVVQRFGSPFRQKCGFFACLYASQGGAKPCKNHRIQ